MLLLRASCLLSPEVSKIELVDQDGNPIPYQRFLLRLRDGSEYSGFLDEDGKVEVDVKSSGEVFFPGPSRSRACLSLAGRGLGAGPWARGSEGGGGGSEVSAVEG